MRKTTPRLSTATPGARSPTAAIAIITSSSSVWIQAPEPPTPATPIHSCICANGTRVQSGRAAAVASKLASSTREPETAAALQKLAAEHAAMADRITAVYGAAPANPT
jgi:hypothetical protein